MSKGAARKRAEEAARARSRDVYRLPREIRDCARGTYSLAGRKGGIVLETKRCALARFGLRETEPCANDPPRKAWSRGAAADALLVAEPACFERMNVVRIQLYTHNVNCS